MYSCKVAADGGVVEARGRKRPLGVALTASRRQRVGVNVVVAVTVDAQVARAAERSIVLVAPLARDVVVRAFEREVAHVVQRFDIAPVLVGVTGLAYGAVLAFVDFWLWVTTEAVFWPWLEGDLGMALAALAPQVLSLKFEVAHGVVIEDHVARLQVTGLALLAEFAFVHVVLGVQPSALQVLGVPVN